MTESQILNNTVIKNGYCIGCGACTSVKDAPFTVKMDKYGNMVAYAEEEDLNKSTSKVLELCPFSDKALNEDDLGNIFYPENKYDNKIGKYQNAYAGYVIEKNFREKGSSGGFGKWIGYKLLQNKLVDGVFQLESSQNSKSTDLLFDYKLFKSDTEIIKGSKAAYYPTTLDSVIKHIRNKKGNYAITGVPCFIKAIRLSMLKDPTLNERIKYTIGIICGGMKSANHAKFVGWQLGVKPSDLKAIDFRRKYKDRPASFKIYQVWSNEDNKERFKDANDLFGTDYGAGYFKPKACDYCDDVVGETADISVGDAWIEGYSEDPNGNNLIIVRNKELSSLINESINQGDIKLDTISGEQAVASQSGGFRHRREGLSHRLAKSQQQDKWTPKKRIKAEQFTIPKKRKRVYEIREQIALKSHPAFYKALEKNDINVFYSEMNSLHKKYQIAKKGRKISRIIKKTITTFIPIKRWK